MNAAFLRSKFYGDELAAYCSSHTSPPDDLRIEHRATTESHFGSSARMQIGDDQATLMEIVVRSIGVRRALEIGTFTGTSAMAIARGLARGGRLLCCDVNSEWTAIATKYWEKAGLSDRIELRIAPAIETIRQLSPDDPIDFVFIDADKPAYLEYYEAVLPLLRVGGLILVDNTLQAGAVLNEVDDNPNAVAMRRFNDHVVADTRVLSVLVPIGDGLTFIQKL